VTLRIKNLTFSYEKGNVINDLSLELKSGSTTALIGSSGSGKTTLLKLITGLLNPIAGSIQINGTASYLMQENTLLPWRTVDEHLTLIAEFQNVEIDKYERQELLRLLGLGGKEHQYPHQLSGGMKRRVSFAQAILRDHSLLLMDEPFSSLDVHTREQLFKLLKIIQEKNRSTVLIVTHDYRDAITVADEILWLNDGSIGNRWNVDDAIRQDPSRSGHLLNTIRQGTYAAMDRSSLG